MSNETFLMLLVGWLFSLYVAFVVGAEWGRKDERRNRKYDLPTF